VLQGKGGWLAAQEGRLPACCRGEGLACCTGGAAAVEEGWPAACCKGGAAALCCKGGAASGKLGFRFCNGPLDWLG
jgi:hypothetical protein